MSFCLLAEQKLSKLSNAQNPVHENGNTIRIASDVVNKEQHIESHELYIEAQKQSTNENYQIRSGFSPVVTIGIK